MSVAHFGNRFKTICAAARNNLEQDDDECWKVWFEWLRLPLLFSIIFYAEYTIGFSNY